jgi:hypothetical protein
MACGPFFKRTRAIGMDLHNRELLLFFHRYGYGADRGKTHFVAFHLRDEALVKEVMVALVAALAAVLLGQRRATQNDLNGYTARTTVHAPPLKDWPHGAYVTCVAAPSANTRRRN